MNPPKEAMLAVLARDIDEHSELLRPIDAELVARLRALTAGVEVDLDCPLPKDPQGQTLFTVDAETFRQFYELLDEPAKDNPGLARLMSLTSVWREAAGIKGNDSAK